MINIKKLTISLAVIITLSFTGCGGSSGGGSSGEDNQKKVNISFNGTSFVGEQSNSSRSSRAVTTNNTTEFDIDDSLLKSKLQTNSRGNLINRYTPAQFILDIDVIALSNKSFLSVLPETGNVSHLGGKSARNFIGIDTTTTKLLEFKSIPKHYSIIHADKIIRNISVNESSYKSFWIEFLPSAGENSSSNDNYYVNSLIVLDLGEKYKNITLSNELNISVVNTKDTEHIFSFATLQPFESSFFGSILFSSDVTKPYFIDSTDPLSSADGILLPQPKLDFTNFENPTVNLAWDIDNLIEIYDNGTENNVSDDIVTFNLSNPFPVSMKVVEQPSRGESLYTRISNASINNANTLDILKDKVKTVITDDDGLSTSKGTVRFSSNSYNVNEANENIKLQVIREAGKSGELTIDYSVIDENQSATIYNDYFASLELLDNNETNETNLALTQHHTLSSGSLTWEDGDMNPKYINIPLHDDNITESMEYFDIQLTSTDITNISGWSKTRINIYDNNNSNESSGIVFSSNYFYGIESNNTMDIELVRIGNPDGTITIDMSTQNALATKDIDFISNIQTLIWNDKNMTSRTYQITVIDDNIAEPFSNNSNDIISPSEVYMLAARGTSGKTVLQWINPNDADFDYILITRKESSAPSSKNDGEEVYKSYTPYYQDLDGTSGIDYYYLVQTVDKSGNISQGKSVHKIQN